MPPPIGDGGDDDGLTEADLLGAEAAALQPFPQLKPQGTKRGANAADLGGEKKQQFGGESDAPESVSEEETGRDLPYMEFDSPEAKQAFLDGATHQLEILRTRAFYYRNYTLYQPYDVENRSPEWGSLETVCASLYTKFSIYVDGRGERGQRGTLGFNPRNNPKGLLQLQTPSVFMVRCTSMTTGTYGDTANEEKYRSALMLPSMEDARKAKFQCLFSNSIYPDFPYAHHVKVKKRISDPAELSDIQQGLKPHPLQDASYSTETGHFMYAFRYFEFFAGLNLVMMYLKGNCQPIANVSPNDAHLMNEIMTKAMQWQAAKKMPKFWSQLIAMKDHVDVVVKFTMECLNSNTWGSAVMPSDEEEKMIRRFHLDEQDFYEKHYMFALSRNMCAPKGPKSVKTAYIMNIPLMDEIFDRVDPPGSKDMGGQVYDPVVNYNIHGQKINPDSTDMRYEYGDMATHVISVTCQLNGTRRSKMRCKWDMAMKYYDTRIQRKNMDDYALKCAEGNESMVHLVAPLPAQAAVPGMAANKFETLRNLPALMAAAPQGQPNASASTAGMIPAPLYVQPPQQQLLMGNGSRPGPASQQRAGMTIALM